MKIFQKTRKVAKKAPPPKQQPTGKAYTRAAAPGVAKEKKRKQNPAGDGLALGPLTARQRRCVAAAAAGAGLTVTKRPDCRGVQAATGKRRPRAERYRTTTRTGKSRGGEAPDAWVAARVASVLPSAAAALTKALAAAPAAAPPFLRLGDASTADWAATTPATLIAWDGDQGCWDPDRLEAKLAAAEARAVSGSKIAHVVCLNPRGPRRRFWAENSSLKRGPWANRAVLVRVADSRCGTANKRPDVKSGLARLVAEFGDGVDVVFLASRNKKLAAEIKEVAKRVVVVPHDVVAREKHKKQGS